MTPSGKGERFRVVQLPASKYKDFELDSIRLINVKFFDASASAHVRCKLLSLVAQGVNTAAELAKQLNVGRTAVYRHLNALVRQGWLVHMNNKFYIAAKLFLAFDVSVDAEGKFIIEVMTDRGAFIDETVGLAIVKGPQCQCEVCTFFQRCLRAVKELARKLDVKIRSESPLEAFRDIVETLVRRDVVSILKKGYLVVKVSE